MGYRSTLYRSQHTSAPPPPPPPIPPPSGDPNKKGFWNRTKKLGVTTVKAVGVLGIAVGVSLLAFFAYDYTTYKGMLIGPVEVPNLAINPRRGGPKNLPICDEYLDALEPEKRILLNKPRLVILGSGWGSVSLLKDIDPDMYDITVISPTNYFLFTPMLPSATVGTLDLPALVEPIRRVCQRTKAHFLEGFADDVIFDEKLVEVTIKVNRTGELRSFYVPYDKLVVAVGCVSNTHGVPGVDKCNFLKTIQDARNLRGRIMSNLEHACLPSTSDFERRRLLSFVVCGGGPTGVEIAAEIYDLLNEDLNTFPQIVRNQVSVHLIQSQSHILNTYDEKISEFAADWFQKDNINLLCNSRVERVEDFAVMYSTKDEDGNKVYHTLPCGVCVWSTGVALSPLTKRICQKLGPEFQQNKRAIETDSHLRVLGTEDVYAIGDCSSVKTSMASQVEEMIKEHVLGQRGYSLKEHFKSDDVDISNVVLSYDDLVHLAEGIRKIEPQTSTHLLRMKELFNEYDFDNSGTLSIDELTQMLKDIDKKITSLPATAQRAAQQGKYLARKFSVLAKKQGKVKWSEVKHGDIDQHLYRPFQYHHLGSLAYISNAAVADVNGKSYFGGLIAMYLWRGVYFTQTVSFRTRALMFFGWLRRGLFGRDMADIVSTESDDLSKLEWEKVNR